MLALASNLALAAKTPGSPDPAEEQRLIQLLKSSAAPGDKAITCKKLAIYGSAEAVPVLASLLSNPSLSSWARIALEAIPGEEADAALRDAVATTQGRLLQGVINSIGVRRDAKAVGVLASKLEDADPGIVGSAAVALGRIGGDASAKALRAALKNAAPAAQMDVAEGAILCGEGFLNAKKNSKAQKLYDAVIASSAPKHKQVEATRGTILARGSKGIPLLLVQLRSNDKDYVAIGLRTARELPGAATTKALAKELGQAAPERQTMLLLALADRGDATALPVILEMANTGTTPVRVAAIGVLEKLGSTSSLPALLNAAVSPEKEVSQAAKASLTRLPGAAVDAELVKRLATAGGVERQTLIELAGRRQVESALPAIKSSVRDSNAGVRKAAYEAIGILGKDADLPELTKALQQGQDREQAEAALLAVTGRAGAAGAKHLLPLAKDPNPELRAVGLRALASAGGASALSAVQIAVSDSDQSVQDEAVRTLASWPNTWPDDKAVAPVLLDLAKNGKKNSHQVLALRGYLQFLQGCRDLKDTDKVVKLDEAVALIKRPEEKRMAIPILQPISTPESLELLMSFAGDPAVADDASAAIVKCLSAKPKAFSREQRVKALELVLQKTANDNLKKQAEKLKGEA
jgi:HEAT repeat protein